MILQFLEFKYNEVDASFILLSYMGDVRLNIEINNIEELKHLDRGETYMRQKVVKL